MTSKRRRNHTITLALGILGVISSTAHAQQTLSLQEAVNRAVTRSPQVAQAQADVQIQTERKRAAWSNIGPKVSVSYSETRFEDEQVAQLGPNSPPITLRDDVTKSGSLTITQPVTGLYALVENSRLNSLQTDLSEVGLERSKRDVGIAATESYLQAFQAQEQQRIAETSLLAARSAYNDAQAMQRVGRLSQGDLLKFQVALSQAESRLAQARANKEIALAALRQAIQAAPEENIVLNTELPNVDQTLVNIKDVPTEKLLDRSEIKQAAIASEIADYSKKLAYARMIPNVNLFAKWDRNFGEVTGLGGEKDLKYYGVNLQWDIWNNGSSFFEVREALALKDRAEAALTAAKDGVKLDAVQASENFTAAKDALRLAQDAVKQAEEAYRIDQIRFKNGQISATDLIQSEATQTNVQGQLASARSQLVLWYARLQRALGQTELKF